MLTNFNNYIILMYMLNVLPTILKEIGLPEKEAQVLNILLQSTSLKVSELAERARINRTTADGLVKSLLTKGLVTSSIRDGVAVYQSIEPELLISYIDRQKEQLELKKSSIAELLPELNLLRKRANVLPRLLYFEGLEGVKQAYEDTLENNNGKFVRCLSGPDAIYQTLGNDWINYYVKKRSGLGIRCVGIAAESEFVRYTKTLDQKFLRETLVLPKKYALDTEINIYDDKVAIFSFAKERPIAIIIEDAHIAKSLATLFGYIEDAQR